MSIGLELILLAFFIFFIIGIKERWFSSKMVQIIQIIATMILFIGIYLNSQSN